jgi:hypothetical protein
VSGFREEGFISTWQLQAIVSFLIKKEGLGADLIASAILQNMT